MVYYNMPYRKRAVKRIRGQRKLKAAAPTVKFTLTKVYELTNSDAHSSVYAKRIQCGSPFGVFQDVKNSTGSNLGNWEANDDTTNQPVGLDTPMYNNYNGVIVKGCHVTASVTQAPDVVVPTTGDGSEQTLSTGQITLARTADILSTPENITSADIKTWFGQKTRNFQLAKDGALTKNAYVSNGYSARKQFNTGANGRLDLILENNPGPQQDAVDPTNMYIIIKPRKDIDDSELPLYLKPMLVTVRVSYICQFQDPNNIQSVPLPISTRNKKYNRKKRGYQANAFGGFNPYAFGAMAAPAAYAMRGLYAANRMIPNLLPRAGFNQRVPGWLR